MVYLDNAATSYPKPQRVYDEVYKCMKEYCANPGRGGHELSIRCGRKVSSARESVSRFFNLHNPMNVVFTKNTTEALNIAICGFLEPNSHVILTAMEHNSVLRPINYLKEILGIEYTIIDCDKSGFPNLGIMKKSIKSNTSMLACTSSSNVNGIIMPIREISDLCREHGITFLVDGAQGAGSMPVDLLELGVDIFAFPGHKGLFGPQGTGGLCIRKGVKLEPIMTGGTGSNSKNIQQPPFMPDLLESGTLNTPGIVGMKHGIGFIQAYGLDNIIDYKKKLVKMLHEGLKEIKNVILYSCENRNTGIAAFNIKDKDSILTSDILDKKYRIASRAGFHCAPLAHKVLGTYDTGLVRLSVSCFNSYEDIEYTINAVEEISSII